METSVTIWNFLSSISTADFFGVLLAIGTVLGVTAGLTVKLYKLFDKTRRIQEENAEYKQLVQTHDDAIEEIQQTLMEIKQINEMQNEVNLKQIRHSIVRASEEAISDGSISANRLQSLEELFETYEELFHGNGYVKTLMKKVRSLEVHGLSEE
ncbi:hypothetical protein MUB23_11535 [Cuneatibacter sp. NSJ-177]|uniref:hypothetical protein n=1 Tax=Cuneatibacter sp. NSJ-177 TaxID=2931401 RepID=UPI001FD4DE76|nr:hypothetical protein [Cuneatibacter sp. NSJ-177]MCJ7836013.1 hypothetical protein [Cuneatibacter sp. NSJ-177]